MAAVKSIEFLSHMADYGRFAEYVPNAAIKNEPMFFNCDFHFAYQNGGPITKAFLGAIPNTWQSDVVFDSRVHMLMPGWYPCIPGWHHDDVPRSKEGQNTGQPDYENMAYKSEHIIGLVNANICPTNFALGRCIMPEVPDGEIIYKRWHDAVQCLVDNRQLGLAVCNDRTLYYFDWQSFHTGTKAVANGWRWFGRISRGTNRVNAITNEIRVNAQVYLEFPTQGW